MQPDWETRGMSVYRYPGQDFFGAVNKINRTQSRLVRLELDRETKMKENEILNHRQHKAFIRPQMNLNQHHHQQQIENQKQREAQRALSLLRAERRILHSLGVYDLDILF